MSDNLKWYALRVISGKESKTKVYLENEIVRQKLTDYVPQIVVPTEKVYRMQQGKKVVKEKNAMPGYMMVSADINYGEVKHVITNIPGIIGFLGIKAEGGVAEPVPLRQSEVSRILGSTNASEVDTERFESAFIVGQTVKLVDGAFTGFNGTIEEIDEDRKKLKVMVLIFGRKTPVVLDYLQVVKE